MAAACLTSTPSPSSSQILKLKSPNLHNFAPSIHLHRRSLSHPVSTASPPPCISPSSRFFRRRARFPVLFTALDGEAAVAGEGDVTSDSNLELKKQARPCELYVCNFPRSCDIAELVEMFKPFGTVLAAEVSRNPETGISKGCGYVTMGSINSAKVSIAALDGSDVGGREMRVKFAVDMNPKRRNPNNLHSSPRKNIIYESPYKIYIGNLAWDIKPEDLRNLFNQFGTVVSAKVLNDRRAGTSRLYGFLSFSSAAERDAAISLDGTEFKNRKLVVREGVERNES